MGKTEPSTKYDSILAAALTLFTTHGFHGTPTSRIAQEAGVATGTLFHHFESKEALIDTLYLSIKEELAFALRRGLEDGQTVQANVKQLWLNTLRWIQLHPVEHQFLTQFGSSTAISTLSKEQAMTDTAFMAALVERGKREGILKDLPTELLGELHYAMTQAAARYFLTHPDRFENAQHLERAFEAYWDAIKT
jgi:AcrR family transcriptional regulator